MKKLFTFLMAMMVVAACFAQNGNKYEVVGIPASDQNMDRSSWYGWFSESPYVHCEVAESEYFLFIPAGTFQTQVTLEQVRFYTSESSNISNYTGPAFTLDNNFEIRIYTGSAIDGLDFNPGTLASSQTYNPAAAGASAGAQLVSLENPFVVNPSDNVTISIHNEGPCSMGLCDDDPSCATANFANWPEYGEGIHHYYWTALSDPQPAWAYQGYAVREHDPWNLSVYYNDGNPYTNLVDIKPMLLDPEEDNYTEIDNKTLYVDINSDALYYRFCVKNTGVEDAIGDVLCDLYITCPTAEQDLYFMQGDTVLANDTIAEGALIYWESQPWILFTFVESDEYPTWDQLESDYGISLPFELCIKATYYSAPGYVSVDNDTENDTYCLSIRDVNELGIYDNNNNLNVAPNPASTTLTIENAAGSQIFVYNIAGQQVMSVEAAEANETLNVSNLNAGLYIVRVVNGNEVSTAKVSIVR